MGLDTLPQLVWRMAWNIGEICGAAVFLTFVIVRALKEIRSIIESGRKDK